MRDNIIFGIRPIMEAIQAGKEIQKVMLRNGLEGELFRELQSLMRSHNIPSSWVPIERLNRFTQNNHQGAVAFLSTIEFADLDEVLASIAEKEEAPLVLLLDGVTDVRNFGAIARTAECAGVQAIIMPAKGGAPINADAMKTSAGALNLIPVCRVSNLRVALYALKDSGYNIVAATEKAESEYYQADFTGPTALIMGAEDVGIAKHNLALASTEVRIPLAGTIGSLNVSAAAAVLLFEAVRQRKKA